MKLRLIPITLLVLQQSCSSQVIETGRNAFLPKPDSGETTSQEPTGVEPRFEQEVEAQESGETPTAIPEPESRPIGESGEAVPSPAEATQPSSAANQPATTRFSCWGKAARDFAGVTKLCESAPDDLKLEFATALDYICAQKKLLNLLHPKCGWDGFDIEHDETDEQKQAIKQEQAKHVRVLAKTELTDQSTDYYYLSASAINFAKSPNSFASMATMAYSDPEGFRKIFELPSGPTITPIGDGLQSIAADQQELYFHFQVQGLTLTKFKGRMVVWQLSEDMSVVLISAVDELVGLKKRAQLNLILRGEDNIERVLTIEERLVPDGGNHPIAYAKNFELDLTEMKNRFRNSAVQNAIQ